MINKAEKIVSEFYNSVGWETKDEITEDARRFEDLRESVQDYVRKCRLRVLRHIPVSGENILDMASGPIQYKEYLQYSKHFNKRYCVDLSAQALEEAKKKIGSHGEYFPLSFFDINFDENYFDCSISIHTIYHIDKDNQEEAIRKLLFVTKKGAPIIIIYNNQNSLVSKASRFINKMRKIKNGEEQKEMELYFYCHPVQWWNRFNDNADLLVVPWRSFASNVQKKIIPNNVIGKFILNKLFVLEDKFPKVFVNNFQYYMIILRKR